MPPLNWDSFQHFDSCVCSSCVSDSCDPDSCDPDSCDPDSCDTPSLYEYSYRPRFRYHSLPDDGYRPCLPYLGLELEVEARSPDRVDRVVKTVSDISPLWYCKEDGSLGMTGVEIVNHPATLDYHLTVMPWRSMLGAIGPLAHVTPRCGIHIHISRDAFKQSDAWLWRFARLLEGNRQVMIDLAGRDNTRGWCAYNSMQTSRILLKKENERLRYRAVNLTNDETIEIRIFQSTTRYNRVMAYLELVHNMWAYSQSLSVRDVANGALGWSRFGSTIRTDGTAPHLVAYAERLGLL